MITSLLEKNKKIVSGIVVILSVFTVKLLSFLLNSFFQFYITNYLSKKMGPDSMIKSMESYFLFATKVIFFAPLLETLIFQYFLIEYVFVNKLKKYAIVLSALSFGLTHYYSIYYIILSFFAGLVLSYTYVFAKNKNLKPSPFFIVFIVHLICNLLSFIVMPNPFKI